MAVDNLARGLAASKAGGGGGTSNYGDLTNKPQINGVELSGNKSTDELGIIVGETKVFKPTGTRSEYFDLSKDEDQAFLVPMVQDILVDGWKNKYAYSISGVLSFVYYGLFLLVKNIERNETTGTTRFKFLIYREPPVGDSVNYDIEYIYTHATSDWIYVKNEELDNGNITAVYSDESLGKGLIHLDIASKGKEIYTGSPLGTTNTQEFVPIGDYNPATKKFVIDTVKTAIGTALEASY